LQPSWFSHRRSSLSRRAHAKHIPDGFPDYTEESGGYAVSAAHP
jgi:hypothetical protein